MDNDSPELSKPAVIGGIDRKLPRRTHVHAGQVADGVVVLGVAQAARQHRPRIAGILSRLVLCVRRRSSRSPAGEHRPAAAAPASAASPWLSVSRAPGPSEDSPGSPRPSWNKAGDRTARRVSRRHGIRCNSSPGRGGRSAQTAFQVSIGDLEGPGRGCRSRGERQHQHDHDGVMLPSSFSRTPSHEIDRQSWLMISSIQFLRVFVVNSKQIPRRHKDAKKRQKH